MVCADTHRCTDTHKLQKLYTEEAGGPLTEREQEAFILIGIKEEMSKTAFAKTLNSF